LYIKWES